jgi:hypothetical protein
MVFTGDIIAEAVPAVPDLYKNTFYPSFQPDHQELIFYTFPKSEKNRSIRWDIALNDTDF